MKIDLDQPLLFVSDIDGTLLRNRRSSSDLTSKTIKKVLHYQNGRIFKFAVATGRSPYHLINTIRELGLENQQIYSVSCNGAVVQDLSKKKTLVFNYLDKEILKKIAEIYTKHTFGSKYTNFSALDKSYKLYDNRITQAYESWIRYSAKYIDKMDKILDEKIAKVSTFSISKNHSAEIFEDLKKSLDDQVTIIHTGERLIEIMPPNSNKLYGVQYLQKYLNIPDEQVIVVGDNENDQMMLEYYENSYVVKNATKKAIDAASHKLTWSNREDAIARLILEIMN